MVVTHNSWVGLGFGSVGGAPAPCAGFGPRRRGPWFASCTGQFCPACRSLTLWFPVSSLSLLSCRVKAWKAPQKIFLKKEVKKQFISYFFRFFTNPAISNQPTLWINDQMFPSKALETKKRVNIGLSFIPSSGNREVAVSGVYSLNKVSAIAT